MIKVTKKNPLENLVPFGTLSKKDIFKINLQGTSYLGIKTGYNALLFTDSECYETDNCIVVRQIDADEKVYLCQPGDFEITVKF